MNTHAHTRPGAIAKIFGGCSLPTFTTWLTIVNEFPERANHAFWVGLAFWVIVSVLLSVFYFLRMSDDDIVQNMLEDMN